ncbi:MAG: NAD-dependent deacylase [Bacteroidaceae bacterium]|nr:NAD-dependent deacylase [Bacteroidaceae bacterium]
MKQKLVVLTGAGMSAESGISTFRDSGGLWEQYRVEDVATIEGYIRNPKLVIDFYNQRRRELQTVKPCRGHELLAELEQDYDVTIVTQNVDNLHERAGSTKVVHLHGELMKATSSRNPNDPSQIITLDSDHLDIHQGDKAKDGSQLRPFIVWFGEAVPEIERAAELASEADIFVVIGTSLNVYPAAGLIQFVNRDTPIYLIDPKPVKWQTSHPHTVIQKGASEGVAEMIEKLKSKSST